jgi:cytochrome c oxidase subunit 1
MYDQSQGVNYLNCSRGFRSWFGTLDHKRLGLMYMWSVMGAMLIGGVFAMLIRLELFAPGQQFVDAEAFNQLFTLHGAIMVFLVIIPGVPAALGNFALPLMLGAKDVAFPKLNRLSYHLWVVGALFFVGVLLTTGLDTGWTFYAPYSTLHSQTAVVWATFGAFFLGFSSIFTGINFIATIHKMRPPGMTWFKLPLFCWGLYATAIMQILATPVLGITLLLVGVERMLGVGIFNPALGGDPVLFQHLFWFYSHPAVYIMVLPPLGIISELIATYSRKHIFGYRFIAMSSVAIALVGFIVWGHHMFTSGQSPLTSIVFSAITFFVAIPSAIKVFNWVATLYKGSIVMKAPMIYALSVIWLFGIGGMTGLWLTTLQQDIHLHDTYFVVAHFHFVMVGTAIFAMLGGMHHWWPKMFGRMYPEKLAQISSTLTFIGFNLTFLPQFVAGTQGMPRRYFDYAPRFEIYNQLSSIGAAVIGISMLMTLGYLLWSIKKGKRAPANPWGAVTLEWHTAPIPLPHNFDEAPVVGDPYDMSLFAWSDEEGGYVPCHPVPGNPYGAMAQPDPEDPPHSD